jgi:hypothetical protein
VITFYLLVITCYVLVITPYILMNNHPIHVKKTI